MAKGKAKPTVSFDKKKFLLPKMEVFWIDEEAGEGFFLRELGGDSMVAFLDEVAALQKEEGGETELKPHQAFKLMARYVVLAACDGNGQPIFTEADIPLLREKNPNIILDIANVAMPLSGLNPQVLGEVAVDLKNDLTSSLPTDLPMNSESQ